MPNKVADLVRQLESTPQNTPEHLQSLIACLRECQAEGDPLLHLWRVATGDQSQEPDQSEDNVCAFYSHFPMLSILRPFLCCPTCCTEFGGPGNIPARLVSHAALLNYVGAIGCLHEAHGWTASQIADWFEELLRN